MAFDRPEGFDPMATCPAEKRARYAARAARAHQYAAAVELKCLECVSWERKEAALCQIKGCPLYALNRARYGGDSEAGIGSDEPSEGEIAL